MLGGPSRGPDAARTLHDMLRDLSTVPCPVSCPPPSPPFLCCLSWCSPGACSGTRRVCGGGVAGGGVDAGTGPRPPVFPLGGADACSPRQGVTLLYGPSICTRSVPMDLRRSQVLRPFPTPGSGTLWVKGSPCGTGASLDCPDGRCALPAAPHWARTAVRAVGSARC